MILILKWNEQLKYIQEVFQSVNSITGIQMVKGKSLNYAYFSKSHQKLLKIQNNRIFSSNLKKIDNSALKLLKFVFI